MDIRAQILRNRRLSARFEHVEKVNRSWYEKFQRRCPAIYTTGKRKGQNCRYMKYPEFPKSYVACNDPMDFCCYRHHCEEQAFFPEFWKEYEEAKAKDEAQHRHNILVEQKKFIEDILRNQ